jgi:hypothetical protein
MNVWQDMPNGGKAVGAVLSFLAITFPWLTRRDYRAYWRAVARHMRHGFGVPYHSLWSSAQMSPGA